MHLMVKMYVKVTTVRPQILIWQFNRCYLALNPSSALHKYLCRINYKTYAELITKLLFWGTPQQGVPQNNNFV
jgi:hypothetical protein